MKRILFGLILPVLMPVAAVAASAEWEARTRLAQELDIGESAPDWLVESETYAIGYQPDDWDALAQSKVAFITHCPVNHEFFARCHALGIRCFPYVTFYQGFASQTYENINLKDHPEFIEVDAEGNLKRTGFWESEDAKNMYTTCPNVHAYQDAMVDWVRRILEAGANGVFVDNLSSRAPCFGPKFGKHEHLYEDQNHAFAMLLKRVRELVKQYQPEGAVLGNSASPTTLPKEFWKYLDAEMLESYVCTWVSTERWFDWKTHWNKAGKDLQPYVKAGKQIQALSYLGHTPYGVRADAFFCYASARLAGFVWNGGVPLSNAEAADLYRLRLGKPLTDELESNGIHYRIFERGLVAVNPDREKSGTIPVAPPTPGPRLFDLFGDGQGRGRVIDVSPPGALEIPSYSGRVYLFAAETRDELAVTGPKLTVVTAPALGEVRFRVDGFDYWTYSGHWTTEYVLGPNFGKFHITFVSPGKHTIEIIDVAPADMKTPKGYGSGERLGQFMDPSNPTQPSAGKKFKFREWEGLGPTPKIEVDVSQDTTVTADFEVNQ
ncbi:MAG: hypothetical protein HY706_14575 [Candidatus Hydrogenedentes bacterium]|nr:hypothetical protein [Candidatus Hydrogenedentota bacterium]